MAYQPTCLMDLTEHRERFLMINPYIYEGYCALPKPRESKLANVLFGVLLGDKRNKSSKIPDEELTPEDKRIYTKQCLTIYEILDRYDPSKYADGTSMKHDVSNMIKLFKSLDKQNILHMWNYNGRYMFFMDRDISAWTVYNSLGTISPRYLKKFLKDIKGPIDCMGKAHKMNSGGKVSMVKIERSFCRRINGMIDKLPVAVAETLPKWEGNTIVYQYADFLGSKLEDIKDCEGKVEAEDFIWRLPYNLREQMFRIEGIEEEEIMNRKLSLDMEKITPSEAKIGVKKVPKKTKTKTKTNKKRIDPTSSTKNPSIQLSGGIDPFHNATKMTKFIQMGFSSFNELCRVPSIASQTKDGGILLDLLTENGRKDDREFLLSWIKWYSEYHLKGTKANNIDHTCINKFAKTFLDFNSSYKSEKEKLNFIPE